LGHPVDAPDSVAGLSEKQTQISTGKGKTAGKDMEGTGGKQRGGDGKDMTARGGPKLLQYIHVLDCIAQA